MTLHWFLKPEDAISRLAKLGPFFYSTIGVNNFLEWQKCLRKVGGFKSIFPIQQVPCELKQEYYQLQCDDFTNFAKKLKQMGVMAQHAYQEKPSPGILRSALNEFRNSYDKISWHIIYGSV